MSVTHDEKLLRFSFDDDWRVLKWDEHPSYTGGLSKTSGTKAVDFLGIHLDAPWFIEVKDFRGYRIENKERISAGDLAQEVAENYNGLGFYGPEAAQERNIEVGVLLEHPRLAASLVGRFHALRDVGRLRRMKGVGIL